MNSEFFIAKRIYFDKEEGKKVSPPAIRIAIISMALGLLIMILSVFIVVGFKKEVREKVIGFGSHIQISNFNSNTSYDTEPIAISDTLLEELKAISNVRHVQKFATIPAIIKTDEDFLGIIIKGVDEGFDWNFFRQNLIEGDVLKLSPDSTIMDVLVSKEIANKLNLKLHDTFVSYFIQEPVRARRYHVVGIYQTNFVDYDKLFILGDIKQIRRLSGWENDMVSGLEILIKDYAKLDLTLEEIYYHLSVQTDRLGNHFYVRSIKQLNPMIFAWLDVLDMNVVVILILMILVAGFSMISGLLIIILERANMIGILKALGQNNNSIRKIFLYISIFIIGKSLFWGNLIALLIYFVQKYTGILKLDPEVYYISEVPMDFNLVSLFLINIGTFVVTLLILLGPSYLVAKISPAKTIRFE